MVKEYIKKDYRYILLAICLMLIFFTIIGFLYLKADEITKHPCEVCASSIGKNIICTTTGFYPITKTFYSDNKTND